MSSRFLAGGLQLSESLLSSTSRDHIRCKAPTCSLMPITSFCFKIALIPPWPMWPRRRCLMYDFLIFGSLNSLATHASSTCTGVMHSLKRPLPACSPIFHFRFLKPAKQILMSNVTAMTCLVNMPIENRLLVSFGIFHTFEAHLYWRHLGSSSSSLCRRSQSPAQLCRC